MLTGIVSLDATAFDPRRDQRQAINKWSKYILGTDYIHLAARFCPKAREYVPFSEAPAVGGLLESFRRLALAQKPADVCISSSREKKRRKNVFDVCKAVHEPEYQQVKRPIDTRTEKPIEPAHKFEVTLGPDNFTEEKSDVPATYARSSLTIHKTDTSSSQIINELFIMKSPIKSQKADSSAFFALDLSEALLS